MEEICIFPDLPRIRVCFGFAGPIKRRFRRTGRHHCRYFRSVKYGGPFFEEGKLSAIDIVWFVAFFVVGVMMVGALWTVVTAIVLVFGANARFKRRRSAREEVGIVKESQREETL